jgi:hypothetical protein
MKNKLHYSLNSSFIQENMKFHVICTLIAKIYSVYTFLCYIDNWDRSKLLDLQSELKILIHVGENENIVNILGACTKGKGISIVYQSELHCLRNRKRVACIFCVIIDAGNVRRIREKRATRGVAECFTRFSVEYSHNIPRVHYHTINPRDEFFYFFYNMTQKIDIEIFLTCTQ